MSRETYAYGRHRHQFGELTLPDGVGPDAPVPVAVLVHGGSWLAEYDLGQLRPAAEDLAGRGWAAWNIEYRRLGGDSGGGWPQTLHDVSAAVDHLEVLVADGAPLDLGRVVLIGHSAGGHLALLDAARDLQSRAVELRAAVGIAPLTDLAAAHARGGGATIEALLGGTPTERPEVYAAASPTPHLPSRVPRLLVHGDRDAHVPAEMSVEYVRSARRGGDAADLRLLPGLDHFEVVYPASSAWAAVVEYLAASVAPKDPGPPEIEWPEQPVPCPSGDPDGFDTRELLGLGVADAEALAERHDCTLRVVVRDGRGLPRRRDRRPYRINVAETDGWVVGLRGIG
jgi:acetyl esterase/lipase